MHVLNVVMLTDKRILEEEQEKKKSIILVVEGALGTIFTFSWLYYKQLGLLTMSCRK